jgi:hypothetical protein
MIQLKQISRGHFRSEDPAVEVFIRSSGQKINNKNASGNWKFSSKHCDMMPHQEIFTIIINGELRARDIFEDDIPSSLRNLGYQISRN